MSARSIPSWLRLCRVRGMEATMPVVTDVHHPPTAGAIAVDDVEFPRGEIRLLGPQVRHPADLHVVVKFSDEAIEPTAYTGKPWSPSPFAGR